MTLLHAGRSINIMARRPELSRKDTRGSRRRSRHSIDWGREGKEKKDWVAPEREVDSDGMGKFNGEAVRALRRMQSPLEIGQCERAKKELAGLRATAGGTASQSQQHLWWHNNHE
jgi:hypothetical protein